MEENLIEVEYKPMGMQEAVGALFADKVLLIKGLEQSRKADVLVRLNTTGVVPVTQISYDVIPPDGYWRKPYWIVYDLPLNVLSTYPCYIYDPEILDSTPKYLIGDTVYYTSKQDSTKDSALVTTIYRDNENQWYYRLSRDQEIYSESEISTDRLK